MKSILVVDDMLPILDMFKTRIPKDQYDVVITSTVKEAKCFCSLIHFDIILTDIKFDSKSEEGIELVQYLIDITFLGKIGVMSGYLINIPDKLKNRVDFTIHKPFTISECIKTLRSYN